MHSCNCRISRGLIGWAKKSVAKKTEHTKEFCTSLHLSLGKGFTLEISGFILVSWWANPYRISPMALAYCTPYSWLQSWACEFQPLLTLLNSCVIESSCSGFCTDPRFDHHIIPHTWWFTCTYLCLHQVLRNTRTCSGWEDFKLLVQPAKCRIQLRPLELLQSPKV